jgi:hypothetical protein
LSEFKPISNLFNLGSWVLCVNLPLTILNSKKNFYQHGKIFSRTIENFKIVKWFVLSLKMIVALGQKQQNNHSFQYGGILFHHDRTRNSLENCVYVRIVTMTSNRL